MSKRTFGEFVVTSRRERGLTQKQFLDVINAQERLHTISATQLSEVERGYFIPKADVFFMIADALGVSVDMIRAALFDTEGRTL